MIRTSGRSIRLQCKHHDPVPVPLPIKMGELVLTNNPLPRRTWVRTGSGSHVVDDEGADWSLGGGERDVDAPGGVNVA